MGDRRVVVGSCAWKLPAGDVTSTLNQIQRALETGTIVRLELLDTDTDGVVTVYLNGGTTAAVAAYLGGGPKPSEISGSARPSTRRVVVGGSAWGLPAGDVTDTVKQIEHALSTGTVVRLELLDIGTGTGADGAAAPSAVTLYLNGRIASTVAIGLGGGPKPSEISG